MVVIEPVSPLLLVSRSFYRDCFSWPVTFPLIRVSWRQVMVWSQRIFAFLLAYLVAGAFIAAGFADFSLIAYHFQRSGSVAGPVIPSTTRRDGFGRGSALVFENGSTELVYYPDCRLLRFSFFRPLVFFGHPGLSLWNDSLGIGMGAQNSLLSPSSLLCFAGHSAPTASVYSILGFGVSWFLGSW